MERSMKDKLLPLLRQSEITGKTFGKIFMEKKTAREERIILMHHDLRGDKNPYFTYFLVNGVGEDASIVKKYCMPYEDIAIKSQIMISGYSITESENKVVLFNPVTSRKIYSPDVMRERRTIEYVTKKGEKFNFLSVVTRGDDEFTVEELLTYTDGDATETWKSVEMDINIKNPSIECICIDNQIYFFAQLNEDAVLGVVCYELNQEVVDLINLPDELRKLTYLRLVNLHGGLAIVQFENLREGLEIWRLDEYKNWTLWHSCNFDKNLWSDYGGWHTEYWVSHATLKGEIVLTLSLLRHEIKPEQPVYIFLYDPQALRLSEIDINKKKMKLEQWLPILTGAYYIDKTVNKPVEDAEDKPGPNIDNAEEKPSTDTEDAEDKPDC